ncbi:MAG: filamentous hemagglutinin N-terminal domain-containing protein, partial [Nitrospira sp.]|nr:filamentous hemagglutinin N-terminal domain-containing protein [Nitrospira sp.]
MRYIYFPTLTIRWVVISSALAFCTGQLGASPQSVHADTSISPTGETGSPASLGTVITPGSAPTGLCTVNCVITGGTRAGSNLFHSFGEFSVGPGDTATFRNDSGLATDNILGRVTGGIRSDIFGRIQTSDFGNANLFLINPAGFLFGPGATINVGGMVSFTSADYLKSADGARFNVDPSPIDNVLLSAEPVAAFGFLGSNPGAITVQGSQFVVTSEQSISLVGGNITIEADPDSGTPSYLSAPSGQINLVSVAADGEVSTTEFLPGNGMVMGNILLAQGATVDASGDPGGTVRIRSGQFEMDQAYIFAGSSGDINGATTAVSVNATGDMLVKNQSSVDVTGFGAGRTGNIEIEARSLMLTDGSIIANQGIGSAPAGNISLMIEQSLTLEGMDSFGNGSLLQTSNAGSGTGGAITLTPQDTQTSPNVTIADSGKILTQAGGQSAAGDITMQVANLTLRSGASIQTFGAADAPSGNIHVNATGDVSLIGQGDFPTRVISLNSDAGGTGWIKIESGTLSLTDKAQILSETASLPGSPPPTDPKVLLTATDSVTVAGGSRIDLFNNESSVGSLNVHAGITVTISDLGLLNTSTIGSGNAGAINLTAGQSVYLTGGASITASSTGPGNAGDISINAGDQLILQNSSITTQANQASGGKIDIR